MCDPYSVKFLKVLRMYLIFYLDLIESDVNPFDFLAHMLAYVIYYLSQMTMVNNPWDFEPW